MTLPPQAIDRLTRTPSPTIGAYQNLLMLAGTLFVLTIIMYVGLRFGYTPYLNRQSTELDAKIQQFGEQVSREEQESLRGFYSQLANLKILLTEHTAGSPVLVFLEKNTLPQVYYNRAKLNMATGEMILEGTAPQAEDAAAQVALFERAPEVRRVNFSSIARADKEKWQFNITIVFQPNIIWQ